MGTPGREGEFQQKVEVATQPLDVKGGVRQWRVTVTTAVGARGQDYHLSDELVDDPCRLSKKHWPRRGLQQLGSRTRSRYCLWTTEHYQLPKCCTTKSPPSKCWKRWEQNTSRLTFHAYIVS